MSTEGKWEQERAMEWHKAIGPVRGCNYLPRTAVNTTEMWQPETFDPDTIREELGWARDFGLNSIRVFLQYIVWDTDPKGFKERFDVFLSIASDCGMSVTPILFCDCSFSGKEPYPGKQDEPVLGVHNSGWVPSPWLDAAKRAENRDRLGGYVTDMVGAFRADNRILMWDLYNEPGNSGLGDSSMWLVEDAFKRARAEGPSQPLTTGPWESLDLPRSRRMMELSDVVSFHSYDPPEEVERRLAACKAYGRPVFCTEWLLRQGGNTFDTILPIWIRENVGWFVWGLVAGRTQTYHHWGSQPGSPIPSVWQHDLLHTDGTPYSPHERALLALYL